jgi:hypothetical protein
MLRLPSTIFCRPLPSNAALLSGYPLHVPARNDAVDSQVNVSFFTAWDLGRFVARSLDIW